MNDPKEQPVEIEEQRAWLNAHKEQTDLPWPQIAKRIGRPSSTIYAFANGSYKGRCEPLAQAVFRFRQTLSAQKALRGELPDTPPYFETETSSRLIYMLNIAQRGRLVTAGLGAGLGKTTTAEHFAACNANVFYVVCTPSSSAILGLQKDVLEAMGTRNLIGSMRDLSRRIKSMTKEMHNPLLILDECQHLTEKSIEEARSWCDAGLGLALFGNEKVYQRIEGSRTAVFAQIFSRQAVKLYRSTPFPEDIEAMLEAWEIEDEAIGRYVGAIAMKPGGLRSATFTLELATMIARADGNGLEVQHLEDAWTQLSSRAVA